MRNEQSNRGPRGNKSGSKSGNSMSRGNRKPSTPAPTRFTKKSEMKGWNKKSSGEEEVDYRFAKPGSKGKDLHLGKKPRNSNRDAESNFRKNSEDKPKRNYTKSDSGSYVRGEKPEGRNSRSFDSRPSKSSSTTGRFTKRDGTDSDRPRAPYKRRDEGDSFRSEKPFGRREGSSYDRPRAPYKKREEGDSFQSDRPYAKRTSSSDRYSSKRGDSEKTYGSGRGDVKREEFGKGTAYGERRSQGKFDKKEQFSKSIERAKEKANKPVKRSAERDLESGEGIRLNRYISNAGICSRREADDLIGAGLVSINDVVVTELGTKVKGGDVVKFNGSKLSVEEKVYLLLNKPKDTITTFEDGDGRNTVMELFEGKLKERVYPVGRLDRNTTGVLILTNDGEMAQRLMHPKYEVHKVYKATLDKPLKPTDLWTLSNGVELEDGIIKPDALAQPDPKNKNVVGVEIHSGKNRIIHRMFEHLGYKVDKLDRVLYADLEKGKLKRGEWRELTEKEIKGLKRLLKLK